MRAALDREEDVQHTGEQTERAYIIEPFDYPAGPDPEPMLAWGAWSETASDGASSDAANPAESVAAAPSTQELHAVIAEHEQRLAEETRRSFEAGREQGRQEGRAAEHEAQAGAAAGAMQRQAEQVAGLVQKFAQERERYLHAVEHEVVKLALAVAARILRREAQMDPLLLMGAVRVALGQLSASTQVRLRVPPADLDLWTEAIALLPNSTIKPQVMPGDSMRLGDCIIETEMGSVDLGVRAQLGEIERGFFDRAGASPTQAPAAAGEQK